jgi:hypothetical protein
MCKDSGGDTRRKDTRWKNLGTGGKILKHIYKTDLQEKGWKGRGGFIRLMTSIKGKEFLD